MLAALVPVASTDLVLDDVHYHSDLDSDPSPWVYRIERKRPGFAERAAVTVGNDLVFLFHLYDCKFL